MLNSGRHLPVHVLSSLTHWQQTEWGLHPKMVTTFNHVERLYSIFSKPD